MRKLATKAAINWALKKPGGKTIPLSGEAAAKNDCYVVTAESPDGQWAGWIRDADSEGVTCVVYDSNGEKRRVLWPEVASHKVEILHYYKYFTFKYEPPTDLLIWEWSGYFKWLVYKERIAQYLYSKTRFVRVGRIEVLRHFVFEETEKDGYQASSIDLVSRLHSIRAFGRSDVDTQVNYYKHICESLISTGDLLRDGINYRVTPKAIATLSEYEEEERKHREMWRVQLVLGLLAAGSVLVGLLQAYVAYVK